MNPSAITWPVAGEGFRNSEIAQIGTAEVRFQVLRKGGLPRVNDPGQAIEVVQRFEPCVDR
jgi:hypothetical protein